ncbi:MAG: winged helix-turn-helix transcriptional regulator [Spirochaetales bacterium]|nr:winged helix-turn-helix transcriptional regulator [Spirochaetales bacterium]
MIKDNQTEYYKALKSSDKNADSTLFIEFMLSLLLKAIEEIIENEKKVTVNQQKILDAIKNNPFITQDELSKVIVLSMKSIIQNMNKMKENSLIKRVGAAKNGHWEIL